MFCFWRKTNIFQISNEWLAILEIGIGTLLEKNILKTVVIMILDSVLHIISHNPQNIVLSFPHHYLIASTLIFDFVLFFLFHWSVLFILLIIIASWKILYFCSLRYCSPFRVLFLIYCFFSLKFLYLPIEIYSP